MNAAQLRQWIIAPVLRHLGHDSLAAQNLLLMTAAAESNLGEYVAQVGGPARSIYQIEPATHEDIWRNYLDYHDGLRRCVLNCAASIVAFPLVDQLAWNLGYATAIARVHYLRVKENLPAADDIQGLATYHKKYFNTAGGAGSVARSMRCYCEFVEGTGR